MNEKTSAPATSGPLENFVCNGWEASGDCGGSNCRGRIFDMECRF